MSVYTEEEILAGCRKGKRVFQEELYKTYYSDFLKVCARYVRNMEDAEQLLNDGFLKIFHSIGNFKFNGSFSGWMRKIIINTCLDHLRATSLKTEMTMHVYTVPVDDYGPSVMNTGLDNIEFKQLVTYIQELPAMTRTVFNLYAFEGLNHREISEQLEISEGTSHWHLHQARGQLQKRIKQSEQKKIYYEAGRI